MEVMVVLGTMPNNMPELPEVETVVKTLKHLVIGKCIQSVKVLRPQNIDGDAKKFEVSLKDKTIKDITRIGKFIIFHLEDGLVMISHLRMEGKYFLKENNEPISKHDLVIFYFKDKTYLTYNDTRRFGVIKLSSEKTYLKEPPISNVGPDPFLMKDEQRLITAFKNKSIAIKTALLDQSVMSGLGNIYVDEVLFLSQIHPETPAKLISKKQLKDILKNSKVVLTKAIEEGGSTIKSYHPQEGINGNFQVHLQVYGKVGQKCQRCGHKLSKIFVNGRGTTYCPKCQKNVALPYVVGITGQISSGKSEASKILEQSGYFRLSADGIVHELYKLANIQNNIQKIIPSLEIKNGEIDRQYLKNYLLDNKVAKTKLEKYLYAEVYQYMKKMISKHTSSEKMVLEVPLLWQSKIDELCDDIIIIESSKNIQKERLLKRGHDIDYLKLNESYLTQLNKKDATAIINNDSDLNSLKKRLLSICK